MRNFLFCVMLLFGSILVMGCPGKSPSNPSSPSSPTPTPNPTITANVTLELNDDEYGSDGDDCEAQSLFFYFTNFGAMPATMDAPCTLLFNGYIGQYSTSVHSQALSIVSTTSCAAGGGGQRAIVTLNSMPATLGQSLTWTSNLVVPSVNQTQAAGNGLPANIYTDTVDFPVTLNWIFGASAQYQLSGSNTAYGFASGTSTSAPISNLAQLQAPQTVILSIPVTIP